MDKATSEILCGLSEELMKSFNKNSKILTMRYKKHGALNIQCIYPRLSKQVIDKIDRVYGVFLGLDDEAIDFLINYDIKYRMGGVDEEGGE